MAVISRTRRPPSGLATGGGQPRWSPDGNQIFLLTPDKKLMAVRLSSAKMTAKAPGMLFETRSSRRPMILPVRRRARRAFSDQLIAASYAPHLTLLTGWPTLLKAH